MAALVSTRDATHTASWRDAVLHGIAPDGGLYVPITVRRFSTEELLELRSLSFSEIGLRIAHAYLGGEIEESALRTIVSDAFNFEVPIVHLTDKLTVLELFHGPTCAFKDFGARFLAGLMRHFTARDHRGVTILVATSGDTGSAVAQAFYDPVNDGSSPQVVILFPKGRVSEAQDRQMTTLGGNIRALEVDGSFDDCQRLVKSAFADDEVRRDTHLASANSINIARLLPQSIYYAYAASRLPAGTRIAISVPSGNLGNLTAGLLARLMGTVDGAFIAATNANDVFPKYLSTGIFTPRASVATLSNAMDVGYPSNFARIETLSRLHGEDLRADLFGAVISDAQTRATITRVYDEHAYIVDPHTAVGFAAFEHVPIPGYHHLIVATAHPGKFREIVEGCINERVSVPGQLEDALHRERAVTPITSAYPDLKRELSLRR